MTEWMRFGAVELDVTGAAGRRDDGNPIVFTRYEALLLGAFLGAPGRALSRGVLLDAVSGAGSDANDRSIDFLVNRLRRKLGDTPRRPRFIATRYGEGYVWVARPDPVANDPVFLLIGPVHGLGPSPLHSCGREFAERLKSDLDERSGPRNFVAGPDGATNQAAQYTVALSFVPMGASRLDCCATLRRAGDGALFKVCRVTVTDGSTPSTRLVAVATQLAKDLLDALWLGLSHREVEAAPHDPPLAVRLHAAAQELHALQGSPSWPENERRLRAELAANPDDPTRRLMLATVLHSKYILSGVDLFSHSDPREADEAEIEALVTSALTEVQNHPILALGAAKLLYFLQRGYEEMALELAERTFAASAAVATGFAVLGQMRMWRGEIEAALASYRQGLELAGNSMYFRFYLLTLMAQAHEALGDGQAATATIAPMCGDPRIRRFYCLFFRMPEAYAAEDDAHRVISEMTPARAHATLRFQNYVCARLFVDRTHRRNSMSHAIDQITSRFGEAAIPGEVSKWWLEADRGYALTSRSTRIC